MQNCKNFILKHGIYPDVRWILQNSAGDFFMLKLVSNGCVRDECLNGLKCDCFADLTKYVSVVRIVFLSKISIIVEKSKFNKTLHNIAGNFMVYK